VIAGSHFIHMFHANIFNVTDRLYRNHTSFVKEFAPEIGVGVRFGYTFQWF
jgi:iron complex outermembrane receptor protein